MLPCGTARRLGLWAELDPLGRHSMATDGQMDGVGGSGTQDREEALQAGLGAPPPPRRPQGVTHPLGW